MSHKEVEDLVEQMLEEERLRQMKATQPQKKNSPLKGLQKKKGLTRMAQSVIEEMPSAAQWSSQICSSNLGGGIGTIMGENDMKRSLLEDSSSQHGGVRMSWQLKRLSSEESGRKRIVNIKLKQ
jgi:hypothetical protein